MSFTKLFSIHRLHNKLLKLINDDLLLVKEYSIKSVDLSFATHQSVPDDKLTTSPLILMHDLLAAKSSFDIVGSRLISMLDPPRKIITIDARNHGESPSTPEHTYHHLAEDIKQLMASLKIPKASLLGHSMGGRTFMLFALQWPAMVDSLIVEESSPLFECTNIKSTLPVLVALSKHSVIRDLTLSHAIRTADKILEKVVADPIVRKDLLGNLVKKSPTKIAWRLNVASLIQNIGNMIVFPDVKGKQFDGRVLFITGGNTATLSKESQKEVSKLFTKATFIEIPGAGHDLHNEKMEEFMDAVVDFLKQ